VLFSDNGFKKLKNDMSVGSKSFYLQGKDHETEDLQKIMNLYEDWAYKLCPIPFDEFISQAEKLCSTMIAKDYLKKLEHGESINLVNAPTTDEISHQDSMDILPDQETVVPSQPQQTVVPPAIAALSAEVLDRIARNKQIALEKRKQKELTNSNEQQPTLDNNNNRKRGLDEELEDASLPDDEDLQ